MRRRHLKTVFSHLNVLSNRRCVEKFPIPFGIRGNRQHYLFRSFFKRCERGQFSFQMQSCFRPQDVAVIRQYMQLPS